MPEDNKRAYHKKKWMLDATAGMIQGGGQVVDHERWAQSLSDTYDAIETKVYGELN